MRRVLSVLLGLLLVLGITSAATASPITITQTYGPITNPLLVTAPSKP